MTENNKSDGCGCKQLEKAEADLEHAEKEREKAEHDIERAKAEIAKAREECHEFRVTVLYDGVKKPFEVKRTELVKKLLDQAIQAFGPLSNPHTLSLFTEAGEELKDTQTIHEAGVRPCEELLLRPSKVKGGCL